LWLGHWWCVDARNRVVDPSWRNEGRAYVGVEVDVVAERRRVSARGYFERNVEQIAPDEIVPTLNELAGKLTVG
jgi:hypothetical protein